MKILAIETSCDETAAAVVEKRDSEERVMVLSSVVASSLKLHVPTGGIVPEVAAREQAKYMVPAVQQVLEEAGLEVSAVDALAVTYGPGLIGSLLVGVETAKTLALAWDKPLVPVNHVVAHLYACWIGETIPAFPAVALAVSGNHTDLVLMQSHTDMRWLGGTRDDAAGECFDKCARILGFPYPGGPEISREAAKFNPNEHASQITLPRPLLHDNSLDFSFSGLKTALKRQVDHVEQVEQVVQEMVYEVQEAITDVLVAKLERAVERYSPASVLVAGGVAANTRLREKVQNLSDAYQIPLFIPPVKLCTDNAVTIGAWALFHPTPLPPEKVHANPGLAVDEWV